MLETKRRDPRAPGDTRMYLYFDYSPLGALRWYVKLSRKGRRIGISEEYGTKAFDAAYDAAIAALGGAMRKRRSVPDPLVQPERRYVQADRSQRGQTRYYIQLRNGLPKIRILSEFGMKAFYDECDVAIVSQIALYGDATDHINAQKRRNEPRGKLPTAPPMPHTPRWYWTLYKQSDHWLGNLSVGHEGLSELTRLQRTGLIESLLPENGEKPFGVLTRKVIKDEMKARTPSQAGNLLSALRGMIRWMIDDNHLDEDHDPTTGLKSGKAKASRESGGFLPWTEDDMPLYRAKWPLVRHASCSTSCTTRFCDWATRTASVPSPSPDRSQDGGANRDREKPRQHDCHGAGASRICRKLAGGSSGWDHWRRSLHRQDAEGAHTADEQEGLGDEVQEVRGSRRRQRAEEELPRRAKSTG